MREWAGLDWMGSCRFRWRGGAVATGCWGLVLILWVGCVKSFSLIFMIGTCRYLQLMTDYLLRAPCEMINRPSYSARCACKSHRNR